MKIHGKRSDGALLVGLGGGVGVILHRGAVSPSLDTERLYHMGPWEDVANDMPARQAVVKALDKARTKPITAFHLSK